MCPGEQNVRCKYGYTYPQIHLPIKSTGGRALLLLTPPPLLHMLPLQGLLLQAGAEGGQDGRAEAGGRAGDGARDSIT